MLRRAVSRVRSIRPRSLGSTESQSPENVIHVPNQFVTEKGSIYSRFADTGRIRRVKEVVSLYEPWNRYLESDFVVFAPSDNSQDLLGEGYRHCYVLEDYPDGTYSAVLLCDQIRNPDNLRLVVQFENPYTHDVQTTYNGKATLTPSLGQVPVDFDYSYYPDPSLTAHVGHTIVSIGSETVPIKLKRHSEG